MTPLDQARKMLDKAAEDELILDKLLDDPDVSDASLGFHAQQAAEKLLKAVLFANGIEFRRSHNLAGLAQLLKDKGVHVPLPMEDLDRLTPFAVTWCYDVMAAPRLDRQATREFVRATRTWAEQQVR